MSTPGSHQSGSPHEERLRLYRDWRKRLGDLSAEMEDHFGEPGNANQDPLDSAVHVAFYIAAKETDFWERAAKRAELPYA